MTSDFSNKNECDSSIEPKIKFLIFVIHGMGKTVRLDEKVASIRQISDFILEQDRKSRTSQLSNLESVEFVKIEYFTKLHGWPSTDKRLTLTQLNTCPSLRNFITQWLVDPLYYFSCYHGRLMREEVTRQLNDEFSKFLRANPNFSGKVAVLAHSMGGLIMWDLLNSTPVPDIPPSTVALNVPIDAVFAMGSPISNAIIIRGHNVSQYCHSSIRFYSIFHPLDPISCRLEPIFCETLADLPPLPVPVFVPCSKYDSDAFHHRLRRSFEYLTTFSLPSVSPMSQGVRSWMTKFFLDDSAKKIMPDANNSDSSDSLQVTPTKFMAECTLNAQETSSSSSGDYFSDFDDNLQDHEGHFDLGTFKNVEINEPNFNLEQTIINTNKPNFDDPRTESDIEKFAAVSSEEVKYSHSFWSYFPFSRGSTEQKTSTETGPVLEEEQLGWQTKLPYRMDYCLQVPRSRLPTYEYFGGLRAHFEYWGSKDILWLALCELHGPKTSRNPNL